MRTRSHLFLVGTLWMGGAYGLAGCAATPSTEQDCVGQDCPGAEGASTTTQGASTGQDGGQPGPGTTGPDAGPDAEPDIGPDSSSTQEDQTSSQDTDTQDKSQPKLKPAGPYLPRIDTMWLTMAPGTSQAELEIGLKAQEVQYLSQHNGKPSLIIDGQGNESFTRLELTEVAKPELPKGSPASLAGLKVFRARVELQVDKLSKVLDEYRRPAQREIVEFHLGGNDVSRRLQAPSASSQALLAGEKVDLSYVGRLMPLVNLGAQPIAVDRERSLLIRDLTVIDDPDRSVNPCGPALDENLDKPWGFGHLMREMAKESGMSAPQFVEAWVKTFSQEQRVKDQKGNLLDVVSDDTGDAFERLLIEDWRERSKGPGLDLRIAPFRLLSIVYRPDLAVSSPLRDRSSNFAGELRFVFGMMRVEDRNEDGDALDRTDTCRALEASVIFEYVVPRHGCSEIKAWANDMLRLSSMPISSPEYKTELAKLTQQVTRSGAAPTRANKSAIGRVRTNEISFSLNWQLREFELARGGGALVQSTVKDNPRNHARRRSAVEQTPRPLTLNESDIFATEVKSKLPLILSGRYVVPETTDKGEPLLGGMTSLEGLSNQWQHRDFDTPDLERARFNVSVNTCGGCHSGDTETLFYHIFPDEPGEEPRLSAFLDESPHQVSFRTRFGGREEHEFDEPSARRQALYALANQVCSFDGVSLPFQLTHHRAKNMHAWR